MERYLAPAPGGGTGGRRSESPGAAFRHGSSRDAVHRSEIPEAAFRHEDRIGAPPSPGTSGTAFRHEADFLEFGADDEGSA